MNNQKQQTAFGFWKKLSTKKILLNAQPKTDLNHKQLALSLSFICLALGAVTFALFLMNQRIITTVGSQNHKISALIDEVGQLRAENYQLFTTQTEQKKATTFMAGLLKKITNEYDTWQEASEELTKTKNELSLTKNDLAKVKSRSVAPRFFRAGTMIADSLAASQQSKTDNVLWNILILGTHGQLTDTIIMASINPRLKTISLFSIPRDLYVNGRKINEMYEFYGIQKTAEVVYQVTGLAADNYVLIDLNSFVHLIDALEGLEIDVDKSISDPYYPGPNDTYTTFTLDKGHYHMDGALALQYARSRKTTSDFDRAKRQQQIIQAVQDRLKALNLINQLEKSVQIYLSIKDEIQTDVDFFKALSYAKNYQNYTLETGNVLTTANYLYSTYNQGGAYILLPNSGNFEEIQEFVRKVVEE